MIIDLLQNIVDYSSLQNQIKCAKLDTYTNENILIYKLTDHKKINQNVLEHRIFSKLKILKLRLEYNMKDVYHLSETLEKLISVDYRDSNNFDPKKFKKSVEISHERYYCVASSINILQIVGGMYALRYSS